MDLQPIPIFSDNYVWTLSSGTEAVVVDPGDAEPVLQVLAARGLQLRAILITHWHPDHIGGLPQLLTRYPVPVYGPRAEAEKIRGLSHPLAEGDSVDVLGHRFDVMEVPGHTLGHIAYLHHDILLCGDTLFSAGCGRLFEGTPAQMHTSLSRLASLPAQTRVCCTHEYTAGNLAFALTVEPDNSEVRAHAGQVQAWRAVGQPSLPSSLGLERRINPFLRCDDATVRASAERHAGKSLTDPQAVFAVLRAWKDNFRGTL